MILILIANNRYEAEHAYAAHRGGRHFKERRRWGSHVFPLLMSSHLFSDPEEGARIRISATPSPRGETDVEYESDFEVDKEPVTKIEIEVEEEGRYEYDNDSFIIDDDGANRDGDLTGSSPEVSRNDDSKVSK